MAKWEWIICFFPFWHFVELILPFASRTKFYIGCQSHVTWHNCVVPSHLVQVLTGQKMMKKAGTMLPTKQGPKNPLQRTRIWKGVGQISFGICNFCMVCTAVCNVQVKIYKQTKLPRLSKRFYMGSTGLPCPFVDMSSLSCPGCHNSNSEKVFS